jgi:putative ABC transport system substrate-binding protein
MFPSGLRPQGAGPETPEEHKHVSKRVSLSRRHLLQGVASIGFAGSGAILWSACTSASPKAKVPRIGVLSLASNPAVLDPFREALRALGYVDGETIAIEYRYSRGLGTQIVTEDLGPKYAAELVALNVDLIVTGGDTSAHAAKDATSTIPIVAAIIGGDPVASGLVASLGRPGGNLTGFTHTAPGVGAKGLQLLSQASPTIRRVFALRPATSLSNNLWLVETQDAAKVLGIDLIDLATSGADDLERAFETARSNRADALITAPDATLFTNFMKIAELALQKRLPAMFVERQYVDAGGLMNYGPNFADTWRRTAGYVDRILKGAKPAELPVEQPTKFDFVINLKTAAALGLTIPQSVLSQATELIR